MRDKAEKIDEELTTIPNEKYRKFFNKFNEIDALDVAQWKVVHLIGLFCRKYKEIYQIDYAWKFNTELPNKSFEVWKIKTLCAKLSANPKILKDYIDWVFEVEVPKTKAKFRSISFLTQEERVNYYKLNILLAGQTNSSIDRSTPLPSTYQDILKETNLSINTYGDLAFLSQMEPMPDNIKVALDKMVEQGFDRSILVRII